MTATATHRAVEVVERAVEAEGRGRGTTTAASMFGGRDAVDVLWADNGWATGVTYEIVGAMLIITREGKGGSVVTDLAAARRGMTPVFANGEAVAAFGDSPRAYPEITDLGWFTRTDQFTAQRWACDTLADVAVELAFLHLA